MGVCICWYRFLFLISIFNSSWSTKNCSCYVSKSNNKTEEHQLLFEPSISSTDKCPHTGCHAIDNWTYLTFIFLHFFLFFFFVLLPIPLALRQIIHKVTVPLIILNVKIVATIQEYIFDAVYDTCNLISTKGEKKLRLCSIIHLAFSYRAALCFFFLAHATTYP